MEDAVPLDEGHRGAGDVEGLQLSVVLAVKLQRRDVRLLREYVQAVRDCGKLQVLIKERRAAVKALNQRLPQVTSAISR